MVVDKERVTLPISNYVSQLPSDLQDRWGVFHMATSIYASIYTGAKLVAAHKEIFGRQTYCYTTYRRYWVWEFEGFRTWVHNEGGISLEVDAGQEIEAIAQALQGYLDKWPLDFMEIARLRRTESEDFLKKTYTLIKNLGEQNE